MAGAPVNLRGSVELARWAGIIRGTNVPEHVRIENGERIQEAINFAAVNRKFLEVDHGNYEFELAGGLVIPAQATGFTWIGHPGATFYQYTDDTPILTVGTTGVDSQKYHLQGMNLRYANDQSGNTGAVALRLGCLWQSRFMEISIASTVWTPKCYTCVEIIPSDGFFQNTMRECAFFRASQTLFKLNALGTGNLFADLYWSGVGTNGAASSVAQPVVLQSDVSAALISNTFIRCNIEWCIANKLLQTGNLRNAAFIDMHMEGNRLTGADPAFVYAVLSQLNFTSLNIYNNHINTNESVSGNPTHFRPWQSSNIDVNGLLIENLTASDVNVDHFLVWQADGDAYVGQPGSFQARNVNFIGDAASNRLSIDKRMTKADFGSYVLDQLMEVHSWEPSTKTRGAWLKPTAAQDVTVYGAHENPRVEYTAALSAHRTVTLSNRMGPAATPGADVPLPPGRQIVVRRSSAATGAFNVLVNNHDGATLSTIANPDTRVSYYFDGTDWNVGT